MIKIEEITIEEFRGIRKLTLELKGKNFAICGPNGTGKSGVVDALEFALTGNISRLSGEGRGDISLKEHAPHVDQRKDPAKARVAVKIAIPHLKKTAVIARSAKTPHLFTVEPDSPDIVEAVKQVAHHPEIMLSRRELIRYVLATPGKRNEEVQVLLHLDQIETVRGNLLKISNSLRKQSGMLEAAVKSAADNLIRALVIPQMNKENILAAANTKRAILNLPKLEDLTSTSSLKEGLAVTSAAKPQAIPKKQATADIEAAREVLKELQGATTKGIADRVLKDLKALANDPLAAVGVNRENFLKIGIGLVEEGLCPFCETEWEIEKLRVKIQQKLEHLKELTRKRKDAEKQMQPLVILLRKAQGILNPLFKFASVAKPQIELQAVEDFISGCASSSRTLADLQSLPDAISILESIATLPKGVADEIAKLEKHVGALPDASQHDAAREFLTIAQERLEVWREAKRKAGAKQTQYAQAKALFDTYVKVSDERLAGLYAEVEQDFSGLYSAVNKNDEKMFSAKLIPSMGKLGFDVDFYGRGFFPPGAYHSEGHQDGMGLCLYLALMRHLQKDGFSVAVLDDVLMSVDTGHRREVCALLKKEFPNTQFILTTHDPIWLRHMKSEGLVTGRSAVHFRAWDVDFGPTQWDDFDVWTEIDTYLKKNDVRAAAGLLRHYLEYTAAELCHRLRAPVEFRADAQFQLGELLPAAVGRLTRLFDRAKDVANSWGQKEVVAAIGVKANAFSEVSAASQIEQWQINTAVHYNEWENLKKEDFVPVVTIFRRLIELFNCSECGEILRVAPDRETPEMVRCDCGKTNLNLRNKK